MKRLLSLWSSIGLAASSLIARQSNLDSCPGYKASNVQQTSNGLTADLTLAGYPCNVYGKDVQDLTLLVEYQTGMDTAAASV